MKLFFLFAICCLLGGYSCMGVAQTTDLRRAIEAYLQDKQAQVGVALIVDGKDTLIVNDACRYPLMSVFKLHQAMAVAHYLRVRGLTLETPVSVRATELKPDTYSPLRDKYPQGGVMLPVSELLAYTLQLSDNNACDILFTHLCGVKETEHYVRSLRIGPFAIAANEDEMHRDLSRCYDNWSTPLAVARLLEMLFTHPVFADYAEEAFLRKMLSECETGKDRLAAPLLHTGATIGHKTGTGDRNAKGQWIGVNDAGFVRLPDGRHYTLVVLVKDSEASLEETSRYIADISALVYQSLCSNMGVGKPANRGW